jgi:DnaJ-domain-containing protein 1
MNYSLQQQIVIRRRSGLRCWSNLASTSFRMATTTTVAQRRQQNCRCFPSYSSSTVLSSRYSGPNQQELCSDSSNSFSKSSSSSSSSHHINTISGATGRMSMQRFQTTTASWLDLQQQQQQQQTTSRQRWLSTMPQEEEEDGIMDYFAIFDMPRRYDLDLKELKRRYLRLMTEYHPDKQQYQPQSVQVGEQLSSSSSSSLTAHDITNAYQILTEPHTRANHLLELIGHAILEDKKCHSTGGESSSSSSALVGMDFLLQVLEWRERIETLAMCSKYTADGIPCSCGSNDKDAELRKIWEETQTLQHHCEEELMELWNRNHVMSDQELQQTRTLTAQLQYWHRLGTALREEMEL